MKKINICIRDVFINNSIYYKKTNINNNDNIVCKKCNLKPLVSVIVALMYVEFEVTAY